MGATSFSTGQEQVRVALDGAMVGTCLALGVVGICAGMASVGLTAIRSALVLLFLAPTHELILWGLRVFGLAPDLHGHTWCVVAMAFQGALVACLYGQARGFKACARWRLSAVVCAYFAVLGVAFALRFAVALWMSGDLQLAW